METTTTRQPRHLAFAERVLAVLDGMEDAGMRLWRWWERNRGRWRLPMPPVVTVAVEAQDG